MPKRWWAAVCCAVVGGCGTGGDFAVLRHDGDVGGGAGGDAAGARLEDRFCSGAGWCWESPFAAGQRFRAAAASAADDAWFVGDHGVIVHWDGRGFARVAGLPDVDWTAAFARKADDVWAVGEGGRTAHWDGRAWRMVPTPVHEDLRAVFGRASELFAVGDRGTVLSFIDGLWYRLDVPFEDDLRDVWMSTVDDVWVAGRVMHHFDRQAWTTRLLPDVQGGGFTAVSGTGPADVWVGEGLAGGRLRHFDGTGWTDLAAPDDAPVTTLRVVADGLLAGSERGLRRFAGGTWTEVGVGTEFAGALADGRVFVGADGLLALCDGSCHVISGGPHEPFSSVSGAGDAVMIGGASQVLVGVDQGWSAATLPDDGTSSGPATTTYVSWSDRWVTRDGRILHWDGNAWDAKYELPFDGRLDAGFAVTPDDLWFVGEPGVIVHDRVGRIEARRIGEDAFTGVWASGPDDVWFVAGARLVRWNGRDFQGFLAPPGQVLRAVWGTARDDVWAVGAGGAIAHFDGAEWSAVHSPVQADLNAVHGRGTLDCWAVGAAGTILRFDGNAWKTEDSGTTNDLAGVHATATRGVVVVGARGTILRQR